MKQFFKKVGLYFGVPLTVAFTLFFIFGLVVEKTNTVSFCASCHSMKPVFESYKTDSHAGNNKMGLVATCTDCHLPQDGMVRHLWVKAKMGLKDVYVEYLKDPKKVNWKIKWIKRHEFTYDSGCIKCHENLEVVDAANPDAAHAHKFYWEEKKHSCTLCHRYIGHKKPEK